MNAEDGIAKVIERVNRQPSSGYLSRDQEEEQLDAARAVYAKMASAVVNHFIDEGWTPPDYARVGE